MAKRERKTFVNKETGHETTTGLPVEQNSLRGQGYVEKSAARSVPGPKPTDTK